MFAKSLFRSLRGRSLNSLGKSFIMPPRMFTNVHSWGSAGREYSVETDEEVEDSFLEPYAYTGEISSEELLDLIKKNDPKSPSYVLIDVREVEEREKGIIPTSIHIPLGDLSWALDLDEPDFRYSFKYEKFAINQRLIFYCLAGKRSSAAQEIAFDYGYSAQNYLGGWREFYEKYPEYVVFDEKLL